MERKSERKALRSFGLLIGMIFSVIGLWPTLFQGEDPRLWALVLGAGLVLIGLVLPVVLRSPHRLWMKVAHGLGWVNTRILLGLIFYGLITPMGLVMRALGKDSMRRALVQDADTYRVVRAPRHPSHLKRQF